MDEFKLIDSLIAPHAGERDDVVLGIGDDGAIVRPSNGEELVIVADTIVEGVHFPQTLSPFDIGYRAGAVNLSDIAAMGAEPRWATLALTLPRVDAAWVEQFVAGLSSILKSANVALVGGDTTRGPLTVTVQIIGAVPVGRALTRHGAKHGDVIYVTGTLGDAAAGLRIIQQGLTPNANQAFLVERFCRPTARLACGLIARDFATACIDISDGLLADLGHIARRSGCGAEIRLKQLPLGAALLANQDLATARILAATGGDDYELCLIVPTEHTDNFERRISDICALTQVGEMVEGNRVSLFDENGSTIDLAVHGYQHFAS